MASASLDTAPIVQMEARTWNRQTRFNALSNLTGERLASALVAFDQGELREAALLWDAMARRDDVLAGVKPKFENDVCRRDWEVVTTDDSPEAEAQKEILTDFWRNVKAVNAFDRNQRGSFAAVVRGCLQAHSFRYSVQHIVWQPTSDGLRAEFEYVPLWFFENRTGELRHTLPTGLRYNGTELEPESWLICGGTGIMEACSVAYMFKSLTMGDWLAFSEKHGLPFPWIEAPQNVTVGSKEWNDLATMAASIQSGNAAVVSFGGKVNMLNAGGSGDLPFPPIIERADRAMAALYRGSDLSTMSRSGDSNGSSVQSRETLIICADACGWVSEQLRAVSATVLNWHGHDGNQPLAYLQIRGPVVSDTKLDLEVDKALIAMGVPMEKRAIAERYERSIADVSTPEEDLVNALKQPTAPEPAPTATNEREIASNAFDYTLHPKDTLGRWAKKGTVARGADAKRDEMRPATEAEARALGIPPAYTNPMVLADPSSDADIIATATNPRGEAWTKQSEAYNKKNRAIDYERRAALHHHIANLDRALSDEIATGGEGKDTAMALRLIIRSGMRNGSEDGATHLKLFSPATIKREAFAAHGKDQVTYRTFARDGEVTHEDTFTSAEAHAAVKAMEGEYAFPKGNKDAAFRLMQDVELKTYGASSLRTSHATVRGDKVDFDFPGKGGHRQRHTVQDKVLAAHVIAKQKAGEDKLFATDNAKTNELLRTLTGEDFKVHDIRAWHGTTLAAAMIDRMKANGERPPFIKAGLDGRQRVGRVVSRALGNTPAMALKTYIHPAVFDGADFEAPKKPKARKAATPTKAAA